MEIWIDTCNTDLVRTAFRYGICFGVTTNPSLLSKSGSDPKKIISELLDAQPGPVAVQVVANDAEEMKRQALELNHISKRIIVKVPLTEQGLMAMRLLGQDNTSIKIPLMATALFHPNQALLAALAGADYVAPYVGRMTSGGIDAYEALQTMKTIYAQYQLNTKILAASLQSAEQVAAYAKMGIHAVTLKEPVWQQLITDNASTLNCLKDFATDWNAHASKGFSWI